MMKRDMKPSARSIAFARFLKSNLFISFILFSALCAMEIWYVGDAIKKEQRRIDDNKISVVAEDLEIQLESIREVVVDVTSLSVFDFNHFSKDKYAEIELLEYLESYQHGLHLCGNYFLKYTGKEMVFTSKGTTVPFEVYYERIISKSGYSEFREAMDAPADVHSKKQFAYKLGENTVLFYPMPKWAKSRDGREGVICFVIEESELLERIERLVGQMDGEMSISFQGTWLLGDGGFPGQEERIQKISTENFEIFYVAGDNRSILLSNILLKESGLLFLFVIIALTIFLFGYVGAFLNFRPIKKVLNKYGNMDELQMEDDWNEIHELLDLLLQGKIKDTERMLEQRNVFKEHVIEYIADGGYSVKLQAYLTLLGISMEAHEYIVMECQIQHCGNTQDQTQECYSDIELLSDEDMFFHVYASTGNRFRILAGVSESYGIEDAMESIQSFFELNLINVSVELVEYKDRLEELGTADVHTRKEDGMAKVQVSGQVDERTAGREHSTAKKVVQYIEENCTSYFLSLDAIANEFKLTTPYLCKIIKLQTGKTYKDYLIGLRMEKAKELLQNEEVPVAEICQRVGYMNVPHFIKMFRQYTGGLTPSKYREMNIK